MEREMVLAEWLVAALDPLLEMADDFGIGEECHGGAGAEPGVLGVVREKDDREIPRDLDACTLAETEEGEELGLICEDDDAGLQTG